MSMELLYIWIGENETGFIKNQGFNFSPKYRFEMRFLENEDVYELDCTYNEDYPNVWCRENLIGLTAIVGENGTGKSSLMRYLMAPDYKGKWVRVYSVEGSIRVIHNLEKNRLTNLTGYSDSRFTSDYEQITHAQTSVYISNAVNQLQTSIHEENHVLDRLVFSPDKKEELSKLFSKKMQDNIPAYPEKSLYDGPPEYSANSNPRKAGNIDIDELMLLHYYSRTSDNAEGLDLIPANSVIEFNFNDHFVMKAQRLCKRDVYEQFRRMHEEKLWKYGSSCTEAYWALYLEFAVEARLNILQEVDPIGFMQYVFHNGRIPDHMGVAVWDYYKDAFYEIVCLEQLLEEFDFRSRAVNGRPFITVISYNKEEQRKTFMDFCHYISKLMHKKCSFVLKYIHIDTSPVSSGEHALRNIFACLSLIPSIEAVFDVRSDVQFGSQVLLLLDEVDLYMHPEWQRRFLMLLAERLKKEYPERSIQLIITTHSPLVLSDIPSGNIIYLENRNNRCMVAEGPEAKETFGSNIFTLLKDSFYLERSLGEFAYSRIREVIEDLQGLKNWGKDEKSQKQRELEETVSYEEHRRKCREYKQLIGIIGEPVVRGKLHKLYAELFSENPDASFERRLTDIRRMLKTMPSDERSRCMEELGNVLAEMKEHQD